MALKAALSVLPILSEPNDPLIVMWVSSKGREASEAVY